MHCLPVRLCVSHQLLKVNSGATQALDLGRKALVHVMAIPVVDPPSVLMVVAHGATARRARSGATHHPSQIRLFYSTFAVGMHIRGSDTHVLILVTGLDAVVAWIAPHFLRQHAAGSMSHDQRTHRGVSAKTLHLIGEDIQICWLGACLFITYVPKRPSFSVSTPCCGATRCQYWTQAKPQASD